MTDRTDFTQKPRTPAEKMREIENRLGLHAKGLIKWALRVKRLERDFAERIHHTINQDHVSGPVPAHPGGIGETAQRFHSDLVEQRQSPYRVPRPDDGVIGPGYHPLRHQSTPSCIEDGPGINLSPDAEPPGSPTVEEVEDDDYNYWVPEPHQQRRECSVVFSENGKAWFLVSSESRADEVMKQAGVSATKHRMVELREGEEIVSDKVLAEIARAMRENPDETAAERDRLQIERNQLKELNESKGKSIEHLCAKLKEARDDKKCSLCSANYESVRTERDRLKAQLMASQSAEQFRASYEAVILERDQLQTRVKELEALLDALQNLIHDVSHARQASASVGFAGPTTND